MPNDPVCEMSVEAKDDPITIEYNGKTYYFCDEACKEKFSNDPVQYILKEKPLPKIKKIKNEGKTDRIIRVVLGIILLISSRFDTISGVPEIIFLITGIILIFSAITRFCLLYKILGINSR